MAQQQQAPNPPSQQIERRASVKSLIESDQYKGRLKDLLGRRAPQFAMSLIQVSQTFSLSDCEPNSVIAAAMIAASLDLPINPNLGFAWIIPYNTKDGKRGQFQMGYKGFIQLAQRTAAYKHINSAIVYQGELIRYDRIKGVVEINEKKRKKDAEPSGYAAYFSMNNGYEHALYWTVAQVKAHAERYSQAYRSKSGPWVTHFDDMSQKTVLKALLQKWGMLSVEMRTAIDRDQTVIDVEGRVMYPDNPEEAPAEAAPVFGQESGTTPKEPKAKKAAKTGDTKHAATKPEAGKEPGAKPKEEPTGKAPAPTAKQTLLAKLAEAKVPFDDFADYVTTTKVHEKIRDYPGYDDIPSKFFDTLDEKHVAKIIKTYGAKT